jgi:uncharacterized protein
MPGAVVFEWDEAKRSSNLAKHGVDFADAEALEWDVALIAADSRKDYKEVRFNAIGPLNGRLHCICFTRRGDAVRVISFRKAHKKEIDRYEEKTGT